VQCLSPMGSSFAGTMPIDKSPRLTSRNIAAPGWCSGPPGITDFRCFLRGWPDQFRLLITKLLDLPAETRRRLTGGELGNVQWPPRVGYFTDPEFAWLLYRRNSWFSLKGRP
jgi:hypothetical protein